MYTSDINEKIDPSYGTGLWFKRDGKRLKTPEVRSKYSLEIGIEVSSFIGTCVDAKHMYASFHVPSVPCIDSLGKTYFNSSQPKESHSFRIDIDYVTDSAIYSEVRLTRCKICRPGDKTIRFESIEKLIEVVESEFERIFGEPWILKESCTDNSWKNYKKELIEEYGE